MGGEPSQWFVKDDGDIAGPLTEAEMREIVMQPSRRSLFVRQGSSAWHPAEVIRNKITALANNGIYVKANGVAEGPFTFTKAYDVLQADTYADAEVRTGRDGQWFPANLWLAKVDELKRERAVQTDHDPMSGAMADIASQAGKFLEQLGNPGGHLLASPPPASGDGHALGKRSWTVPRPVKLALIASLVVVCLGAAGQWAWHAYQCRHITARYRIDASWNTSDNPSSDNTTADSARVTRQPVVGGAIHVDTGQLFRPTFFTSLGKVSCGTAFAANVPGRDPTLVVSALQLLGPVGGLGSDIAPSSIAQQWQGLALRDCLGTEPAINVNVQPIVLSKSAPFPESSYHGDVLIGVLTDLKSHYASALSLSARRPEVGESVSLVAEVEGSTEWVHSAVISSIEDGWIVYVFDDPNIRLRATNGAPLVDRAGEVIAIQVAGGQDKAKQIGIATPVDKFLSYLLSEL